MNERRKKALLEKNFCLNMTKYAYTCLQQKETKHLLVTVGYRGLPWVTVRLPAGYRNRGFGYRLITGPSGNLKLILARLSPVNPG